MNYKAILFEFDGVLGQTMEDNYQALTYVLKTVGISINKINYFLLEGMSPKKVAEKWLKGQDDKLVDVVVTRKEQYYLANNSFEFYHGAIDLIHHLKKYNSNWLLSLELVLNG